MSRFRLHPGREIAVDCAVTALLALVYALTWRWSMAQETAPWAATLVAAASPATTASLVISASLITTARSVN